MSEPLRSRYTAKLARYFEIYDPTSAPIEMQKVGNDLRNESICEGDDTVDMWIIIRQRFVIQPWSIQWEVVLFYQGISDTANDCHDGQNEKIDET